MVVRHRKVVTFPWMAEASIALRHEKMILLKMVFQVVPKFLNVDTVNSGRDL